MQNKLFDKILSNLYQSQTSSKPLNHKLWSKISRQYARETGIVLSKSELLNYAKTNNIEPGREINLFLRKKPTRSISGVTPVTIFTKPWTCSGTCIFCPTAENAPKSYLEDEPGIDRAIALAYDPFKQVTERVKSIESIGHSTDKIEIIISGGTWHDYPFDYQLWFVCNVFAALNLVKPIKVTANVMQLLCTLTNLQSTNSDSKHRCVGLTVETRPEKITPETLAWLRKFGATKVQIGIQSLNPDILQANARGHSVEETYRAINLLRKNGFKIHVHWMCNLFKATPESDYEDFIKLFSDDRVRPDELKIYPCSLIDGTPLYTLYKRHLYEPYSLETLVELLIKCKLKVPEYTRITRLFRDIPAGNIVSGNKKSNLREIIKQEMDQKNLHCNCIRCNEIRNSEFRLEKLKLKTTKFTTSTGTDYFLHFREDKTNKIAAFLRLSIYKNNADQILPTGAMIREVHVYGFAQDIGTHEGKSAQHIGLGQQLIDRAIKISTKHKANTLAVISAVGTRKYYEKRGFTIEPEFGYGIMKLS